MSINVVIYLSFLLPLFLFCFVEYNYYNLMDAKFESFNNNIASSAVMSLDSDKYQDGIIKIDETEANKIATDMLIRSYHLNDDMTVNDGSLVKTTPILKVYVFNDIISPAGQDFTLDEGYKVTLYKPSVVIYTESEPRGVLFNKYITLKQVTVQEAQFKPLIDRPTLVGNVGGNGGTSLNFYVNKVANPLHFDGATLDFPLQWGFNPLQVLSGANVQFSIQNTNVGALIQNAKYTATITGTDYSEQITGDLNAGKGSGYNQSWDGVITIPKEAPIGATVNISVIANTNTGVVIFPSTGSAQIGTIEDNLGNLFRIRKILY